jgi:hypothetical protein
MVFRCLLLLLIVGLGSRLAPTCHGVGSEVQYGALRTSLARWVGCTDGRQLVAEWAIMRAPIAKWRQIEAGSLPAYRLTQLVQWHMLYGLAWFYHQ